MCGCCVYKISGLLFIPAVKICTNYTVALYKNFAMTNKLLVTLLLVCSTYLLQAQTTADSVKAVVNKLFAAMKNSDGSAVQSCFADGAILQTIKRTKEQQVVIQTDTVAVFARLVASMPKAVADERIVFESVLIDGPMAAVWTPYEFYYNGNFRHCGVNHFVLVKQQGEWKIQYLVDTRRKQGCQQ
ncbi:MAG: hypothetical protein RL172_3221 [Bacteroidota bacterium]|jgi:hypothetical protein